MAKQRRLCVFLPNILFLVLLVKQTKSDDLVQYPVTQSAVNARLNYSLRLRNLFVSSETRFSFVYFTDVTRFHMNTNLRVLFILPLS